MLEVNRIRKLCDDRYITLRQLAKDLKLSERAIHLMLSQNTTKLSTLEALAQYFNVDISYFFKSDDDLDREFLEGVNASFDFKYRYDIWKVFRIYEESLLLNSNILHEFTASHENNFETRQANLNITFSSTFSDKEIISLFNNLTNLKLDEMIELDRICDVVIIQFYKELKEGNSMRDYINHGIIKIENVDIVLNTYFTEYSILGKIKEVRAKIETNL